MNIVALVGNVATPPEMRSTGSGKKVCSFRLAVTRSGGGDQKADFFDVVTWDKTAEVVEEYASKGRKAAIEGRLHQSTWEADGQKRSKVEVVAHRVHLLPGRGETEGTPTAREAAAAPSTEFPF